MLGLVADAKYLEITHLISEGDRAAVFPFVQDLIDEGYDLAEFVRGLGEAWRLLLGLRMDPEGAAVDLPEATRAAFAAAALGFSEEDLMRYLMETVDFEASGRFRRSMQPRIQLEALLLRLASMTSFVSFAELISAIEAAGSPDASAEPEPSPRPREPRTPPPEAAPPVKKRPPSTVELPAGAEPPASETPREDGDPGLAWHETIAALRGKGLGADAIALSGAAVDGTPEGLVRARVMPGLVEQVRAFVDDPIRSGTFRRELARRIGRRPEELKLSVESAERPERLTAAGAQRQRLERMMEADPNLRDAVQTLDLELKD